MTFVPWKSWLDSECAIQELGEMKEAEWELVRACKLMPKDRPMCRDELLPGQHVCLPGYHCRYHECSI